VPRELVLYQADVSNYVESMGGGGDSREIGASIHAKALEVPMSAVTSDPIADFIVRAGEPRWYGDNLFEFLIPGEVTGGAAAAFIANCRAGFAPPRHVHTREDEIVHVLAGEVLYEIDGHRELAGPGATVWLPRGVPHAFAVASPVARMLGVISPGEFVEMFRELSIPAPARELPPPGANPLDQATIAAAQAERGIRVIGPPIELPVAA
jgi:mannose-6-phosphate isomerase-like protein (cupin superfamily)